MTIKRAALIPFATLVALAFAGHVSAHNASATPSCSGLSWSAFNYQKEVVNSIVVKVDGVVVHSDPDFKASDSGTSPWSQTASHAWSVVVDAPSTQYDKSFSGTWQACVATTTTVVAPTTTEPTTTAPVTTEPAPTTSVVAVDLPPVPPTTVAPATTVATDISTVNPALPATGIDPVLLVAAFTLVGFGGLVAFAARRKA